MRRGGVSEEGCGGVVLRDLYVIYVILGIVYFVMVILFFLRTLCCSVMGVWVVVGNSL